MLKTKSYYAATNDIAVATIEMIQSRKSNKHTLAGNLAGIVYTCDTEASMKTNYNAKAGELWEITSNSNNSESFSKNRECYHLSEEHMPRFESLITTSLSGKLPLHHAKIITLRPGLLPVSIKVNTIERSKQHGKRTGF
jgi:hypothetical protein